MQVEAVVLHILLHQTQQEGGTGGGGNGRYTTTVGQDGTVNTGGGGGGGGESVAGGDGGSGIVIISYITADFGECTGGTITTDGADTIHTFTSNGTFTVVAAPVAKGNFFMFF